MTLNIRFNPLTGELQYAQSNIFDSLIVDTTTLVVNAAGYTDKVGIGTATPGSLLDVQGGDIQLGGAANPKYLMSSTTAGSHQFAFWGAATAFYIRDMDAENNIVQIFNDSLTASFRIDPDRVVINPSRSDLDFRVCGDTDLNLIYCNAGNDVVGIGAAVGKNTAKLNVDQAAADGAKPVMSLDQADIDDSFIDFIGTSAADDTRSISSDTGELGACFGKFRVEINGVTKWMRVYDDST